MANLESIGGLHYEMMKRCYNENSVAYKSYGRKGIKVCEEWHDREVFRKWANDNGYQKGMRLNRIDSTKDYCPENCVFGNKNCKIHGGKNQQTKKSIKERKQKKIECGIEEGMSKDPLYTTYVAMHQRCENIKHINYKNYGARGIAVCEEWSGKNGFFNFKKWSNDNQWHKGLTLDRKDNNIGYCPENCRWATKLQQEYNKRNNILYEYCGILMPLGMIAKLEGISYGLLYSRVRQKGMSISEAIADIKESGS